MYFLLCALLPAQNPGVYLLRVSAATMWKAASSLLSLGSTSRVGLRVLYMDPDMSSFLTEY
jgi:hypothetical protein